MKASTLAVALLLFVPIGPAHGQVAHGRGVANSYRTIGEYVHAINLWREMGKEGEGNFKLFAIAEFQGEITFTATESSSKFQTTSIVSGIDGLHKLRLAGDGNAWMPITKRELVAGRAVITTEDGKTYTIFNLGIADWAAQIEPGDTSKQPPPTSQSVKKGQTKK